MGAQAAQKIVYVAAAVLQKPDGQILLACRPEGKHMAGLWEFPGGKIEPGETPEMALSRELAEELGIKALAEDLTPLTFASHAYPDFHLVMPVFLCRRWTGAPRGIEHGGLAWVDPAEMGKYPMPDADIPLVKIIQRLV